MLEEHERWEMTKFLLTYFIAQLELKLASPCLSFGKARGLLSEPNQIRLLDY